MTNEIHFIDFEPQVTGTTFWQGKTYESKELVLERANQWIRKNYNNKIVNVETILLPVSNKTGKKNTTSKINMHAGHVYLIQVMRVWYQIG
ncbi:hypothetical protein LY01_02607 [Nonlabens xylanidelens]|uniref:Uncharacterized protein n=1 Tax=Nonlabens xylanidelens TaxID=191564 RepID=A0A2S6IGI3_9FLAO|nr:hypothetical protein [Nonlabens xylanidelens]PPK93322.1 hypothetical protein LY01_02607 [Nonlabens xylanidelens]PQJ20861.1 hypothetical protein BST94_05050 [Nonlabens xylanidelens]